MGNDLCTQRMCQVGPYSPPVGAERSIRKVWAIPLQQGGASRHTSILSELVLTFLFASPFLSLCPAPPGFIFSWMLTPLF